MPVDTSIGGVRGACLVTCVPWRNRRIQRAEHKPNKLFGEERRIRKLALELEAIGPYLAPLSVEEQNRFRLEIGELSFGRTPNRTCIEKAPRLLPTF
jgi:hypothetical protein